MSERFEEKDFSDSGFNISVWKKIICLLRPQYKRILILILFQIVFSIADVVMPLFNRIAIDEFASKSINQGEFIVFILAYLFFIFVVNGLGFYFYFKFSAKVEMGFGYDLRNQCFHKLQSLSFSYYDTTPTGWLLARMTGDISRLAEILSWSFLDIFWGIPLMILMSIVMLRSSVQLTLIVWIFLPIIGIISYFFQKYNLQTYRYVRKSNSKITNDFNEGINGAKTSKTLVLESKNDQEFNVDALEMKRVSVRAARFSGMFRPLVQFISCTAIACVIWIGADLGNKDIISLGTLAMFLQYVQQFFQPIQNIAATLSEFQLAQASGERIVYLLESQPKIIDSEEVIEKYGTIFDPKPENYELIQGDIEFKDVSFYYVKENPVLNHFDLKVKAGHTVALVGETGSGKSTIVNLLCRFYEPVEGSVLIDGVDYRQRSIGWLHSNLGYVLQAPHLFSGTVKENIRFAKLDATDEEIIQACKLVHAHEFIMNLENGYDSQVGEGGSFLSTGQKQLISFARAILANPAIFVLDEATSSIDTETEQIIQHAIDSLMKDKTSFVVAHRLSTIVNADRILVIDKGKIIEDGTHHQLMDLKGRYYQLYTTQFNEMVDTVSWQQAANA